MAAQLGQQAMAAAIATGAIPEEAIAAGQAAATAIQVGGQRQCKINPRQAHNNRAGHDRKATRKGERNTTGEHITRGKLKGGSASELKGQEAGVSTMDPTLIASNNPKITNHTT